MMKHDHDAVGIHVMSMLNYNEMLRCMQNYARSSSSSLSSTNSCSWYALLS